MLSLNRRNNTNLTAPRQSGGSLSSTGHWQSCDVEVWPTTPAGSSARGRRAARSTSPPNAAPAKAPRAPCCPRLWVSVPACRYAGVPVRVRARTCVRVCGEKRQRGKERLCVGTLTLAFPRRPGDGHGVGNEQPAGPNARRPTHAGHGVCAVCSVCVRACLQFGARCGAVRYVVWCGHQRHVVTTSLIS